MEAYVTQTDFEHALKELRRLQIFLTDTFGSKFSEFRCTEDIVEVRRNFGISPKSDNGKQLKSNIGGTTKDTDSEPIVVDPLELEEASDVVVPIVTSTKSLQPSSVQKAPTFNNDPNEAITVPILQTNKVSISLIPPVTTIVPSAIQQKMYKSGPAQNKGHKNSSASQPSTESLADRTTFLGINRESRKPEVQSTPPITRLPPQPQSAKHVKGIPSSSPGEFQLKGRMLYKLPPPPRPINLTSNISVNKDSSNDSVPIPIIGIESMEDIPSPPKRSRPPPLPSFRNRTLGLQSTAQQLQQRKLKTTCSTLTTTTASNEKPRNETEIIQCDLCNLFIYSSQIDSHMKNHSLLDRKTTEKFSPLLKKIHVCPLCSIKCNDLQTYEQHCADNHPEEGYPCPICTRRMSSKSKLKRHMTTHRNLKFECKICGKAYNRSDNLTAHYKTHRTDEEVTVFYCSTCNMAFSSRPGRDKHISCAHSDTYMQTCINPGKDNGNNDGESTDSSENESSFSISKPRSDAIVATERVKIEDSVNLMGIEFEYEGDEDEL